MTGVHPAEQTNPPRDASIGDLMGDIAGDLSALLRQEVELAKAEVKAEASRTAKGAGMLGGAGLAGWFALLLGSFALAFALAGPIGYGWGALIVAAIWAVVAGILAVAGRSRLRAVNPKPELTVQTLEEDVQWARHRKS